MGLKTWNKNAQRHWLLDDSNIWIVHDIVDENINYCFDKMKFQFRMKTCLFVHCSTIPKYLDKELNYFVKVLL